jgi:predicted alpha/beta superfamily hydrolase
LANISTAWLQAIPKEDKDNFKVVLLNNTNNLVLIQLKAIVQRTIKNIEAEERTEDYHDAAWAFKQAHKNGARQQLKFIEDLLSFTN